jgi:hypothetical protein
MTQSRRAYIFEGPGLLRDGGLEAPLASLGFEIHHPIVLPGQSPSLELKFTRHDLLIFRGPWEALPEETLYARQLGSKLRELGQTLKDLPVEERPIVVGLGRWALALLYAEWTSLTVADVAHLHWNQLPVETRGPWLDVTLGGSASTYSALLRGRALPELPVSAFSPALQLSGQRDVGWRFESYLYLFFVDPLALGDGSQLDSFGYENLENLQNNTVFLRAMMGLRND